ncbi:hypothetical protein ACQYRI_07515 [Salmonella enterica]
MAVGSKNILLISPVFFGYEKKIKEELTSQGWIVTFCDTRPSNSFFSKSLMRMGINFLIKSKLKKHHNSIINTVIHGDFAKILFINPEGFGEDFFIQLKKVAPDVDIRLYLWDSIDNKPLIKPTLKYYDKCFTFDRADSIKYDNFVFLPLFYCPEYEKIKLNETKDYDFAFIGTVHSQRMAIVDKFKNISAENNMNFFCYLYIQSRILYWARRFTNIEFSRYKSYTFNFSSLSLDAILRIYSSSKAIIDIEHHKQNGLTMRTFEVLASGIKLITTNKDILNYDLYHPNNVYIIDRDHIEFDTDFLKSDFKHYPEEILAKYRLSSWVETLTS